MKLNIAILLILASIFALSQSKVDYDGQVALLNEQNYAEFYESHQYVLTYFHQGACGPVCDQAKTTFKEVAGKLSSKQPKVVVSVVDTSVSEQMADLYQIENEVEVKFFVYASPIDYDDALETEKVLDWCNQETSVWSNQMFNATQLESQAKLQPFVALFVGDFEHADFQAFDGVTKVVDEAFFAHTNLPAFKEKYGAQSGSKVVVLKHHDEKFAEYKGKFNFQDLKKFVLFHQYPMVTDFNQRVAEELYGESKSAMFLFVNKTIQGDKLQMDAEKAFRDNANALRDENDYLMMSLVDANYGFGERLANHLEVKSEDLPCVRITSIGEDEVLNYHYKGDLTSVAELSKWAQDFKKGVLPPVYQTAEVPENNPGPVFEVVGKTFDQMVLDQTKDVLVMFYAPWCGACTRFTEVMAEASKQLGDNFVMTRVDSNANEVPGVLVDGFPMVKLWQAGSDTPVDWKKTEAERTVENLVKFLKENGKGQAASKEDL